MRPRDTAAKRSGFTLLEMVVVMLLLTTVFALAAPRLGRFVSGRDVVEEARRMLALVRHARAEALAHGERVRVWFDPETSRYGLLPDDGEAFSDIPVYEYECATGLTLRIDEAALDAEGLAVVVFWPDGSIDAENLERLGRIELLEEGRAVFALVPLENAMDFVLEEVRHGEY